MFSPPNLEKHNNSQSKNILPPHINNRPHSSSSFNDVTSSNNTYKDRMERASSVGSTDSRYSNLQFHLDDEPLISQKYKVISLFIPIFLVSVAIFLTMQLGDANSDDAFERDIFTYTGSTLGLLGPLAVIISNEYMVHWRQHPNPLIYWKAVADLMLAVVAMSSQSSHKADAHMSDINDGGCSPYVAAMTQFCILSSECWFFMMAIDLFFSLKNPFTSYKDKYPKYHFCCWGLGAISAYVLVISKSEGIATADICWVTDKTYTATDPDSNIDDNDDVLERNWHAIAFLYAWMLLFFSISIVVFCMALCRLTGGLQTTYQSRRAVLTRTSVVLLIFMLYWFLMFMLYFFGVIRPESHHEVMHVVNSPTTMIWALLPAKGFVTAIVWFSVNSLPSFLFHLFSATGRSLLEQKKQRYVGDFSPQLNKSLRREVLHFTTKGIIESVSKTPACLPHNWAMVSLVSRCEMSEFAVEIEDKEQSISLTHENDDDEISIIDIHVSDEKDLDLEKNEIHQSTNSTYSWVHNLAKPFLSPINITRTVKFKDYCPHVFARIRDAFGISASSYIQSLRSTAKEKLSEGASGAFMFFTKDGKYVVKSTTPTELSTLLKILVPYAEYLVDPKNKGSFLTRFYGCHSIKMYGRDYSFVVMANIFNTSRVINNKYDIKGSWISRNADPIVKGKKVRCRHCNQHYIYRGEERNMDEAGWEQCAQRVGGCQPNVVLKDNDLNEKLRLEPTDAEMTIDQLVADSELLGSLGIMDYSLIVGVCKTEYEIQDSKKSNRWPVMKRDLKRKHSIAPKVKRRNSEVGSSFLSNINNNSNNNSNDEVMSNHSKDSGKDSPQTLQPQPQPQPQQPKFSSNVSIDGGSERNSEGFLSGSEYNSSTYHNSHRQKRRSVSGNQMMIDNEKSAEDFMMRARCVVGPEFFYMGVIDMLQAWTTKKKLERFYKRFFKRVDGEGLSAIEPMAYKKRFQAKITVIFEMNNDHWIDSDFRTSNHNTSPIRGQERVGAGLGVNSSGGNSNSNSNSNYMNQV